MWKNPQTFFAGYVSMSGIIKSIGRGLFSAGLLLVVVFFLGAYLKGIDAFRDALNPFVFGTYLALLPLAPGAFLLWLADYIADRPHENG